MSTPTQLTNQETPEAEGQGTKERLLQAGMEVFAEYGFATASVRQICSHADANPAAINYYFGDKKRFYAEVLATCHLRAWQRRPIPELGEFDSAESALRAWIRWFLELLTVDGAGPLGRLMAREMAEPSGALDELIGRSMAPMMMTLMEIVGALLPDAETEARQLCQQSIVGQCLFYRHAAPVFDSIDRLREAGRLPIEGPAPIAQVGIDRLAAHIATFSLAGLRTAAPATGGNP